MHCKKYLLHTWVAILKKVSLLLHFQLICLMFFEKIETIFKKSLYIITTTNKWINIILYITHCLLKSLSYLITMKDMFLFVWSANTFTCVLDFTSHGLNECSIYLKSLIPYLSENSYLLYISSHELPYFLFNITLELSKKKYSKVCSINFIIYDSPFGAWFLFTLLYKNCS